MKTIRCFAGFIIANAILSAQPYVISTVAGGMPPQTPTAASDVSISPSGLAVDASGNVYFSSRNAVFKLDTNSVVVRIAGNSRVGFSGDGGPALDAQINNPNGLALDRSGNLYIADTGNGRIRRVSGDGVIATVAGTGTGYYTDPPGDGGPATEAPLFLPTGIAFDSAGNWYIADNFGIRMVSPAGVIQTIASCSTYACPSGLTPAVIAVDSAGGIYVGEFARVWKISPGTARLVGGSPFVSGGYSGDGGPATQASLGTLGGLAVNAKGELYLSDTGNDRVLKITTDGVISTIQAGVSRPQGLAFGADGNLYVAESAGPMLFFGAGGNYNIFGSGGRLRRIATDGTMTTIAGNGIEAYSGDGGPSTSAQLDSPWGVAADTHGNVYITDSGNHTVRKIAANGAITTVAGTGVRGFSGDGGPAARAQLSVPLGIAVDAGGNIYVAECLGARVRKISTAGMITTVAGGGTSPGQDGGPAANATLGCPHGVAVDGSGALYIADSYSNRVRKVGAGGTISTFAGTGFPGFAGDGGPAANAQLNAPTSLAMDASGNLYVADTGNNRIRKISKGGTIETVAGCADAFHFSSDDGLSATSAVLSGPQGVAVDAAGNLYIAETQGNHIRRVSAGGIISTIAGRALYGYLGYFDGNLDTTLHGYSGDGGPSTSGRMGSPYGVAVDSNFNVYFADLLNSAVRVLSPSPISNAASVLYGPIAAGEIVTLNGFGLGPEKLATTDGGTQVFFNGMAAQVLYSSATQVAAVVPSISASVANVEVRYLGKTALSFSVPLLPFAPALFTSDSTGRGLAAAIDQDGSYNSLTNSAWAGDKITLFATGDGLAMQPNGQVTVTIGGVTAEVLDVGPAAGQAGVTRIDVKVPINALAATGFLLGQNVHVPVPVVLQVGGISSQPGVYITVFYCCVLG